MNFNVVTESSLLDRFNPYFIEYLLHTKRNFINFMYDSALPNYNIDSITGYAYYTSCRTETLAIDIVEEKEKMKEFTKQVDQHRELFNEAMKQLSYDEALEIEKYMQSYGNYHPLEVINKLLKEMWKIESNYKLEWDDLYWKASVYGGEFRTMQGNKKKLSI